MFRQSGLQMNRDLEKLAARAAPAIFVVLWSTGFIGTKYVLHNAEPPTYLAIRMVTAGMAYVQFEERLGTVAIAGMVACAAAVFLVNKKL
jgi:hypothetical protein